MTILVVVGAKDITTLRQQVSHRNDGEDTTTEAQQQVQKTREEKLAKDRELNQQRKAEADRKAVAAQIIQLITLNKVDRRGDIEFNFSDGKLIKKLHIGQKISDDISRGRLCVARLGDGYEVVPTPVADKIRERDLEVVVVYNQTAMAESRDTDGEPDADEDHYAQFEIPDDLMW
jgi:uncharacterized protein YaiL (DUF2058 family)